MIEGHEAILAMKSSVLIVIVFFFQAEDGIRDDLVTGVQTCALPISRRKERAKIRRIFVSRISAPFQIALEFCAGGLDKSWSYFPTIACNCRSTWNAPPPAVAVETI